MIVSSATFSPCRTWRYTLERTWDPDGKQLVFIGLNPSTADELTDDPTIRRCAGYAERWGYGGLLMLNLFAYRATDPRELREVFDPVGPENAVVLADRTALCPKVVCGWGAWGSHADRLRDYAGWADHVLKTLDDRAYAFGLTQNGQPKHPLYLPADATVHPVASLRS